MGGFDRLTLHRIELPLRRPFSTAIGTSVDRSLILVSLEADGVIGLGEAAPFPGHTRDDVDSAWDSLIGAGPDLVAGRTSGSLSLTAAAAFEQAETDLAARRAGEPMWRFLGGMSPRAAAGWVAAASGPDENLAAVAAGHTAGHHAVKVKIGPGRAEQTLRAVMEAFPDTAVGADANGSFGSADDPELRAIDAMGLVYLEQPFAPDADSELAALTATSSTAVAIDESVPDARAVARACEARLAPMVVLKAGHLGTAGAAAAISYIAAAGLTARIGGLVESAIGRNHALALATLLPASPAGDLVAGSPYFVAEPAAPLLALDRGDAIAASAPGIGVHLDMEVVHRFAVGQATFA